MTDWPKLKDADINRFPMKDVLPGLVLPWHALGAKPPKGWGICDGKEWEGSAGKKYLTPNLIDAFIRGAAADTDQTDIKTPHDKLPGQDSVSRNLSHNHSGSTNGTNGDRQKYDSGDDNNGAWYNHSHNISTDLAEVVIDTVPKHWRMVYIIKLP